MARAISPLLLLSPLAATVAAGVLGASCTQVGCPPAFLWSAELPADLSYGEVRQLVVRACRNGDCVEGDLSSLPFVEGSGRIGHGIRLSSADDPDGGTGVSAVVWHEAGGPRTIELWWYPPPAVDGDRYLVEVMLGTSLVAGLAEQSVVYATSRPNGPVLDACRHVAVEGSTLPTSP